MLITGAGGEIGHGLIERLVERGSESIITLDVNRLEPRLFRLVAREFTGSVLDTGLLERILAEFEVVLIFHLAALLSTRSEFTPVTAHQVNVGGTLNLLEFAERQAESHGRPVVFMYPSSVAAYGLPDLDVKARAGKVAEDDWNRPITMYGCNKLYCEQLGRYYARHYKQLAVAPGHRGVVDFRCVRLPGLVSGVTLPSGGTSDYAAEMIHAAVHGTPYACFVRPDTRIPFMVMPDALDAFTTLASARREPLTLTAYNVSAFSVSAEDIQRALVERFPEAQITYRPDAKRQHILDSWPEDVDHTAAARDWGFRPTYDFAHALDDYLIPTIQRGREQAVPGTEH